MAAEKQLAIRRCEAEHTLYRAADAIVAGDMTHGVKLLERAYDLAVRAARAGEPLRDDFAKKVAKHFKENEEEAYLIFPPSSELGRDHLEFLGRLASEMYPKRPHYEDAKVYVDWQRESLEEEWWFTVNLPNGDRQDEDEMGMWRHKEDLKMLPTLGTLYYENDMDGGGDFQVEEDVLRIHYK